MFSEHVFLTAGSYKLSHQAVTSRVQTVGTAIEKAQLNATHFTAAQWAWRNMWNCQNSAGRGPFCTVSLHCKFWV